MTKPDTRTRREEYADATREALLEIAQKMFIDEGYTQVGVEAIARTARLTRGAFYHHFVDKVALFEALVVRLQAAAHQRLIDAAQGIDDPVKRVKAGTAAFLDVCTEPAYRRLVIDDAPAVLGAARCRDIENEYAIGLLIKALKARHAAGQFNAPDPTLAARMIASMLCEAALSLPTAKDPKKTKKAALDIVARTLAAFDPSV